MTHSPALRCVRGALILACFAAASPFASAQSFPRGSVTASVLHNGLRVILRRTHNEPLVSLAIWVRAGSGSESPANNGVAHLLEHYLFQGKSAGVTDDLDRQIEGMGGSINAETNRDDTHFYVTIPRQKMVAATKVLGRLILHPVFDPAQLVVEKRRASDEVEGRISDPVAVLQDALFAAAFHSHPYRLPIAGTRDSIQQLTPAVVRAFYQTFYRPDNASLVIVGDVTPAQAFADARAVFGGWRRPSVALPSVPREPPHPGDVVAPVIPAASGDQALLGVAFVGPPVGKDAVVMDLIYTLLTSGRRSLLSTAATKSGFISSPGGDFLTTRDPGLFLVWGTAPAASVAQSRQKLLALVRSLGTGSFTAADLSRARQALLGSYTLDNETVADQNNGLGYYDAIGSYTYATLYEAAVRAVTSADIKRVARRYFASSVTAALAPAGTKLQPG